MRRCRSQRRARAAGVRGAVEGLLAAVGVTDSVARKGARVKFRAAKFTLAPFLLLACSLPMLASVQVQRTGDYLSRMDGDGDGKVSLAEYQAWLG